MDINSIDYDKIDYGEDPKTPNYFKIKRDRLLLTKEEYDKCCKIFNTIKPLLDNVKNFESIYSEWKNACLFQFPESKFADLKYPNDEMMYGKVCMFSEGRPKLYLIMDIEEKTVDFTDQAHFDDKGCEELKFS